MPLKWEVMVAGRRIGPGHPVWVVAEMSANHRQSLQLARELVHAARESGADAIKTQTYTPDTLTVAGDRPEFRHGSGSLWADEGLYELYQRAYMPWEWQAELKELAEHLGLVYFSTAYDQSSVEYLGGLDIPALKISSFELVDEPLLERAGGLGVPVILSTGMATLGEIATAVDCLERGGCHELVLLKCTSAYPARAEDAYLRTVPDLASRFGCPVGLSDHSRTVEVPIAAVTLGASVLEVHLTLESGQGVDAGFSLNPAEFRKMVEAVRRVEAALGGPRYGPVEGEAQSLQFRRSLWVVAPVGAGDPVTETNVRSIRPSGGLAPGNWSRVKGMRFRTFVDGPAPLTEELLDSDDLRNPLDP